MRLIDGEAVLSGIGLAISWEPSWNHGGLRIAKGIVESLPAIDAVEVVRCKDCYWWDRDWQLIETKPELRNCKKLRTLTREDWFCAEGRRNDETTI